MFNKSQIEAISHNKGPAIVLAGPGSGKTTVITHRIKNLIENFNVPPEKIMVVTFTKAASCHMKEKFLDIMKESGSYRNYPVTFGTFHSIYYKILRCSYSYGKDSIVSDRTKNDFLKEIVLRLRIEVSSLQDFVQNISGEISRFKGNMYSINDYESKSCKKDIFIQVLNEYEKTLEVEQKIDFEDMLLKCHKLLRERPALLKQWQEVFEYILIDEFQDINRIQYEIIKMLALPQNNIFIVGDDDQSIYGFRGACPEIMFQFKEDYPDTCQIMLNINYRSVPEIVELSHNLIVHNNNRFDKEIISAKEIYPKSLSTKENNIHKKQGKNNINSTTMEKEFHTDIRRFRTQGEELKYLSYQIKKYVNQGIKPEEMAILVRNNSQIPGVTDFLKNEMIDVHSAKNSNSLYQGMVAKDVIAYIKAALYNNKLSLRENENLIYILNKPMRFISRQIVGRKDMDFEGLKRIYSHNSEILKNIEQLQFHLNMIAKLNPMSALTYIRNGTGYEKYLQQYAAENKINLAGLLKQFDKLQSHALEFSTLQEWVQYIDTQSMSINEEKNKENINIMTMHGAKGLEFRVVFIIDANQGVVPSSRALRERDFQEERRVFYVAMTRASEYLSIYSVMESLGCAVECSMFVEEALETP